MDNLGAWLEASERLQLSKAEIVMDVTLLLADIMQPRHKPIDGYKYLKTIKFSELGDWDVLNEYESKLCQMIIEKVASSKDPIQVLSSMVHYKNFSGLIFTRGGLFKKIPDRIHAKLKEYLGGYYREPVVKGTMNPIKLIDYNKTMV